MPGRAQGPRPRPKGWWPNRGWGSLGDLEGGLGEDPGFEGGVVGGDELDLEDVLAGGELGEALAEAVVHVDQLAVDEQVDMAFVALDAGGGLADDLGPDQLQADLGTVLADGLAVAGRLDGELGRAARAGGDGGGGGRLGRPAVVARAGGQGEGGDGEQDRGPGPPGSGRRLRHGGPST